MRYFHDFYISVQNAKGFYLQNVSKKFEPNFLAVNCDVIDDDIPCFDPELFDIREEVLIENEEPQDQSNLAEMPDDVDCGDYLEIELTALAPIKDDVSAKMADLARRIVEKADRTSSESIKLKRIAGREFVKLIPNFFDLTCEICKYRCASIYEITKHYRVRHKETRATVQCCQRKIPINDIRDHILFHMNPDLFR